MAREDTLAIYAITLLLSIFAGFCCFAAFVPLVQAFPLVIPLVTMVTIAGSIIVAIFFFVMTYKAIIVHLN